MQFDPERYPSVDMVFVPTATLGVLAREFEQQQLIGLLQTLGPNTPVLPLLLKGILGNSSLSNRAELMTGLDKMSQPDPNAAQAQQAQQQAAQELAAAQVADISASAQKKQAETQKISVETQMIPQEQQVRMVEAASTNLNQGDSFEQRLKLAEMMLKEKTVNLKQADIASNERIATLQMQNKQAK